MILVKGDAKFPAKNFGDASTGPYIASKTVGFRSMPQKIGHQALLLGGQFDMATMRVSQQAQSMVDKPELWKRVKKTDK